jgi:hypothetical protein
MEAIIFLTFWLGGATVHTVWDLKLKPYLEMHKKQTNDWPYV